MNEHFKKLSDMADKAVKLLDKKPEAEKELAKAAKAYVQSFGLTYMNVVELQEKAFIDGAKWQQKQN